MDKLYYSIGEAAEIIGESTSLVRFWTNSFTSFLKPRRSAKGNRIYSNDDIETLKQIHYLVKEKGLTLDGAEKQMKAGRAQVEGSVKVLDTLKNIREQLMEIRSSL